jgi:cytoskeletal protein RodZ
LANSTGGPREIHRALTDSEMAAPLSNGTRRNAPDAPTATKADESPPLGELLRQSRLRRGMSLQQIAAETRIPLRHLQALECDDFADVPAGLYFADVPAGLYWRAEVRAYARAVHLDQPSLVQLERALRATETSVVAPGTTAGRRIPFRKGVLMALTAIAAALALTFAWRREGDALPAASRPVSAIEPKLSQQPAPLEDAEVTTPPHEAPADSAVATAGSPAPQLVTLSEGAVEPRVVQPLTTELVITSEPPGARVTVDGIGWGFTPVTIRHLPPGAKRVRVTKEGYSSEEREARVAGDRLSKLHIPLRALP